MRSSIRSTLPLVVFAIVAAPPALAADACLLATPAEVEAALGQSVTFGKSATTPNGVDLCSGRGKTAAVTIRHFKRTGDASGEKEKAGLEAMKKAGMKVDVQKSGPITCVGIEGASGAHTSCTAAKPPMFAVIEVAGAKVPMEKLRPVAEKMLTRF